MIVACVAALYVEATGPYPQLVRDWYDEARDARSYRGPLPVVAHPPCERWGRLRTFSTASDANRDLAPLAVEQVRTFGGVLEHPEGSALWKECGLPDPDSMFADQFGGRSYRIVQGDEGHAAPKVTWIYAVRVGPCPFRSAEVATFPRGRVVSLTRFARKATPLPVAQKLVAWAATARADLAVAS